MAKIIKELTDIAVRNAKPDATRPKHIFDGKGLFLLISPQKLFSDGKPQPTSKWWRFKYSSMANRKCFHSASTLKCPLPMRGKSGTPHGNRLQRALTPEKIRKAAKVAETFTFEKVAREWHEKQMGVWSVRHTDDVMGKLEHDVFPSIGSHAMSQLKTSDCLSIIRKIEARGALETAHRTRQILVTICGYALANEYTETNVAALTKGAIAPVRNTRHHPAITDPQELKGLLRASRYLPRVFRGPKCHAVCAFGLCPARGASSGRMVRDRLSTPNSGISLPKR